MVHSAPIAIRRSAFRGCHAIATVWTTVGSLHASREEPAVDGAIHPSLLESISAWVLIVSFTLSLLYELWRATAKAGVSRHDSMRAFVRELWLYALAIIVIVLLLAGVPFAAWIGLAFSALVILASIFYYNPRMMIERRPGLFDWFEDLVYTGLAFVVAALLTLEVSGLELS
jgi:hypothetical protein